VFKKLALLILLLPMAANASVRLTTPYSVTGPTGFATATALNATATSNVFNWQSNTACITYSFGAVTAAGGIDQTFTPLPGAPTVTNCLNLTTGVWIAFIDQGPVLATGTLAGSQLTAAITVYTGPLTVLRDNADYFASVTFLPGTQPDLWGAGDL
jgi:hypothetical protein